MGNAIVFLDDDGIEGRVLERQGLALAAMQDDLLRGGLFHLEARSGFYLSHGVLAGIQALTRLMKFDLATGICEEIAIVDGCGCFGRFTVAGIGDVEFGTLHISTCDAVLLVDGQQRHFAILERDALIITGVQADGLDPVRVLVRQIVGCGNGFLRDSIGAGSNAIGDSAVFASGPVAAVIAVNALYGKNSSGYGGRIVRVDFGDGQLGLLQVLEDELLIITGAQINRLGVGFVQDIGLGHGLLRDLIAVYGDGSQNGLAGSVGRDVLMVAVVDALDLKHSSGNRQLVLLVQLLDGQIGELLVFGRHRDCAAAIDNRLIHVGADGRRQLGIGCGGGHFNEGIHTLRDIGDRDLAGGICGFRADQLAVLENVEHRAGERPVGIIQFDELDF